MDDDEEEERGIELRETNDGSGEETRIEFILDDADDDDDDDVGNDAAPIRPLSERTRSLRLRRCLFATVGAAFLLLSSATFVRLVDWADRAGGLVAEEEDEPDRDDGGGGDVAFDETTDGTTTPDYYGGFDPTEVVTLEDGVKYEVLDVLPHDEASFTQGLTYADGVLYESAGLYGHSKVRKLNATTGEILLSVDVDPSLFAEGMAYYGNDKLVQITWKKRKGFVRNATTLEILREFTFTTKKNEGWGITHLPDRNVFAVSDGSSYLHFWNDVTLEEEEPGNRLHVRRQSGEPAYDLNELEYWRGLILANVWYEDVILAIDPTNGVVVKEYDFSELYPYGQRNHDNADVLNGISVSDDDDVLFVTGKQWNRIFRVRLF